MSSRNKQRTFRGRAASAHGKALFLPLPRSEASALVLRTRIVLERLRNGEADRPMINHITQVVLITAFITRAGFGRLDPGELKRIEMHLGRILSEANVGGPWSLPEPLIDELTTVVNEYDRQLATTRFEIVARASDYLDRLAEHVPGARLMATRVCDAS